MWIHNLKIFRLRRAQFKANFLCSIFRNRFGILLYAAHKCAQIKPAAGGKFSNFESTFLRFGGINFQLGELAGGIKVLGNLGGINANSSTKGGN